MRFSRKRRDNQLLLEITPMVDVVFLLIIFFMTTAQFARITRADIDLPEERGEQEQQSEEAGIVINLMEDGTMIVNEQAMSTTAIEELVTAQIKRLGGDATAVKLTIRADRNTDTAVLNNLLRRLERYGLAAANLATEVPGR